MQAVRIALLAFAVGMLASAAADDPPNRIRRCWVVENPAPEAPLLERSVPSRVTRLDREQRRLTREPTDPLTRLTRLAASAQRPRFPDWPGRPSVLRERFGHLTAPLSPSQPLMPVWTPDAARWGGVQEASLAAAGCPCPPDSPGEIAGLRVDKNDADPRLLDLRWDESCLDVANDYSVHEGAVGSWYGHAAAQCTTGGMTSTTHEPRPGDRYLLVVPLSEHAEGSYGVDSDGTARPRSSSPCREHASFESCP